MGLASFVRSLVPRVVRLTHFVRPILNPSPRQQAKNVGRLRRRLGSLVGEVDAQAHAEGDGQDDDEDDEGAPPLELAGAPGVLDAHVHLLVALLQVLVRLLRLLLGALDDGLLLHDERVQVLEEPRELHDGLLDLQELVVAGADLLLEVAVEGLELPLLHAGGAVGGALDVDLEGPDLVADARVLELGRGDLVVEAALGRLVRAAEGGLVQGGDAVHIGRQGADLVADVRDALEEVLLRERVVRGLVLCCRAVGVLLALALALVVELLQLMLFLGVAAVLVPIISALS
ncbi:hypothetical protein VP1G_11063 [Cytospora mali]|uniref:Uncharacterized protein n=1 Tax=Cytospora mali TaxID=578113 RepID=A0A194V3I0_CYTMA|nr:hypothetical protein VP1G_11063 [Valsa mali var. pyri (nom. inval.)]